MKFTLCATELQCPSMLHATVAALALAVLATPSFAAFNVTISKAATHNGTLSGGVFTPTANNAVVNVTDLKNALAISDVAVNTGTSGSQTGDITVNTKVAWPANKLTLDAFHSVEVAAKINPKAAAGLAIKTNDGGSGGDFLTQGGRIYFNSASQSLTIDGTAFTLVPDIATLASDISGNPIGHFALMDDYDASAGLTYTAAPIPVFGGTLDGLGNTISNFKLIFTGFGEVGLFGHPGGIIRNLNFTDAFVSNVNKDAYVGILAAQDGGQIVNVSVGGTVSSGIADVTGGMLGFSGGATIRLCSSSATVSASGPFSGLGGLVGLSRSSPFHTTISNSSATGAVNGSGVESAGGLIGQLGAGDSVTLSFATGNVTAGQKAGGLAGVNAGGNISQSYATGQVTAGIEVGGLVGLSSGVVFESYALGNESSGTDVGGLIGSNQSPASVGDSYSAGAPTTAGSGHVGGLIGIDGFPGSIGTSYWDTTTSGITSLSQGAGSPPNDVGITGLSDAALKSGLPSGFSSADWAESSTVNGGLPYLKDNPPL